VFPVRTPIDSGHPSGLGLEVLFRFVARIVGRRNMLVKEFLDRLVATKAIGNGFRSE
jgi:hypothetical protein